MRQHFNRVKLCEVNLLEVSYDEMLKKYYTMMKIVNEIYGKNIVKTPKKCVFIFPKTHIVTPGKHPLNRVYSCQKCKKEFKYQSSCSRHYNKCIEKSLYKRPVKINNFGEEKTNHVTDKILLGFFATPYNAIQKICKEIHFNNKQPENQNIKLTNKTGKYINIYIKNKWYTIDINKVYNKIIDCNIFILNDFFKRHCYKLSYSERQNFEAFKIGIKYNKKIIKNIKDSLKELFINKEIVNLM